MMSEGVSTLVDSPRRISSPVLRLEAADIGHSRDPVHHLVPEDGILRPQIEIRIHLQAVVNDHALSQPPVGEDGNSVGLDHGSGALSATASG